MRWTERIFWPQLSSLRELRCQMILAAAGVAAVPHPGALVEAIQHLPAPLYFFHTGPASYGIYEQKGFPLSWLSDMPPGLQRTVLLLGFHTQIRRRENILQPRTTTGFKYTTHLFRRKSEIGRSSNTCNHKRFSISRQGRILHTQNKYRRIRERLPQYRPGFRPAAQGVEFKELAIRGLMRPCTCKVWSRVDKC